MQTLLQGSTQSAFEIGTNGQSLRALIPNPTPEKGELLALVTTDGNLMMANLKEKSFVPGPNGQVLKDGVSCISWSAKGKQLVAGLGNGTASQMTPDGIAKAQVPKPSSVGDDFHSKQLLRKQTLALKTNSDLEFGLACGTFANMNSVLDHLAGK